MNISAELHSLRDTATKSAVANDIQGAIFISVLALCGIVGNSILIDVYLHTRKKVLSTYFMIILGVIDLIICSIIMPMRVTFLFVPMPLPVCCMYQAVAYVAVSCSIYLFMLIAIDRYQSICRLGQPLFTIKHLKFLLTNMCVSNIFICVLSALYLQGYIDIDYGNSTTSILMRENFPCYVTSMLNHPKRKWDARFIIHLLLAVLFTLFMLGVSTLYVEIFKTLKQIDAFRSRFKRTIHPWMPDDPGPSISKLEARPCYMHMFNTVSQNNSPPLTSLSKVKGMAEGTGFAEGSGNDSSVRKIKTCEIKIKSFDGEGAESKLSEFDSSKSQQGLKESDGDVPVRIMSSEAAWEFPICSKIISNKIQIGEEIDDNSDYIKMLNKTPFLPTQSVEISISHTENENHGKISEQRFGSVNKVHFTKTGWNSASKKKTKMRLKSRKCKKSKNQIEEEHSPSTHSIQTIAEEIILPHSDTNSSERDEYDCMRVWATRQSLSIPDAASISINLRPFHSSNYNSNDVFSARDKTHPADRNVKTPTSKQSSKSGCSDSMNGNQASDVGSNNQQALLSSKILLRLFLVTLFYCLCWLPFYLIELAVVPYDTVLIQTFFMANMVNPFIHLTTSKPFRNEFVRRFKKFSRRVFTVVFRKN